MNYKAYAIDEFIKNEVIIEIGKVKNKVEMRKMVLNSPKMRMFTKIIYGRRTYSMSDIYAGR